MAFEDAVEFMRGASAVRNGLRVVPFAACREAARRCGISAREAEAAALRAGLCPSRYERSVGTVGLEGQARLLESCAAVAGCGGLGGWIIEILARAGVGKLILADGDTFGENNLNRQLYAAEENLGEPKAEAAARRVRAVNSAVEVKALNFFLDEENCEAALEGADVVLDALDGLEKYRGCPYNWYDAVSMKVLRPAYVSSVDCGNLIAALLHVASIGGDIGKTAENAAKSMDLSFIFRGTMLRIGYNTDSCAADNGVYDLLASESALTYLMAYAEGLTDKSGYLALAPTPEGAGSALPRRRFPPEPRQRH